jgi:hypothetical protein
VVGTRQRKFAIAVVAVAAMLLGAAPVASGEHLDTGRPLDAFVLQGSNGYRIDVWAFGRESGEGSVVILATRRGRSAGYVAEATITETRIDADLGELGHIALEFVPTGGETVTRPVCDRDEGIVYDKGRYAGEFEFRGEEGFTTARATRIAYSPDRIVDLLCGTYSSGELFGPGNPGARLTAHARLGKGRVSLQVNQNRPDGPVRVRAAIIERRDGILIEREVGGTDPGRAFEFGGRGLSFAAARPDAPFSGTGTFRRGANPSNRWTGNLEVDFPGRRNVPLTGERFRAKLIHARLTEEKVREGGLDRPNLGAWLSTKVSPSASATPSLFAPK